MTTLIDQLRELESKATPLPWKFHSGVMAGVYTQSGRWKGNDIVEGVKDEDAQLIALMRNSLPHFLALVEAVEPFFPRDSLTRCALDSEYNAVIDALKALKEEV